MERDIAILLTVYKYRYLSFSQLARLYFPPKTIAYRRLLKLRKLGYIKHFTALSIPEYIYYLDTQSAELVAESLHVEVDQLKWHRSQKAPKDYYFLRHFLAINDFRITLTLACQESPLTLLGFIPEYVGEKTSRGNMNIAPFGRAFQQQSLDQGSDCCALDRYRLRLIRSPSS